MILLSNLQEHAIRTTLMQLPVEWRKRGPKPSVVALPVAFKMRCRKRQFGFIHAIAGQVSINRNIIAIPCEGGKGSDGVGQRLTLV